jgi:hypothetical protein
MNNAHLTLGTILLLIKMDACKKNHFTSMGEIKKMENGCKFMVMG